MKYTNENGRSMVEMLGVLAIIGVLSVGGIAGYSKAMNKFKINKTTDQVSMLVANLRTMFSSQGNYDGLTNAQAVSFGVVPDDMYDTCTSTSCTITNPFGGAVKISSSGLRTKTDEGAFYVAYDNLSQEACVTLATGDWGSGHSSGLIAVVAANSMANAETGANNALISGIDDTAPSTGGQESQQAASGYVIAQPGGTIKTPMPVASAVTGCGSSSGNAVAWKYY